MTTKELKNHNQMRKDLNQKIAERCLGHAKLERKERKLGMYVGT